MFSFESDIVAELIDKSGLLTEQARVKRELLAIEQMEFKRVIGLGMAALKQEKLTPDGMVEKVWSTVRRHVDLLQTAGVANISPGQEKRHATGAKVTSNSSRVTGSSLVVSLALHDPNVTSSQKFWEAFDSRSLSDGLNTMACPQTSAVIVRDGRGEEVDHIWLDRRGSIIDDPALLEEWGEFGDPFRKDYFLSPPKREYGPTLSGTPLSPNHLVVAAGYDAQFNLLLDEFEAGLGKRAEA